MSNYNLITYDSDTRTAIVELSAVSESFMLLDIRDDASNLPHEQSIGFNGIKEQYND